MQDLQIILNTEANTVAFRLKFVPVCRLSPLKKLVINATNSKKRSECTLRACRKPDGLSKIIKKYFNFSKNCNSYFKSLVPIGPVDHDI